MYSGINNDCILIVFPPISSQASQLLYFTNIFSIFLSRMKNKSKTKKKDVKLSVKKRKVIDVLADIFSKIFFSQ